MSDKPEYSKLEKIDAEIARLQAESAAIRAALINDEIKAIKAKIKELALKPSQLFSAAALLGDGAEGASTMGEKIAKAAKPKEPAVIKYRGPNGETWSGGRGRKPAWIQEIIDAGGDIEKFKMA